MADPPDSAGLTLKKKKVENVQAAEEGKKGSDNNGLTKQRITGWKKLVDEKKLQEAHDAVTKFFKKGGLHGHIVCHWCQQGKQFAAGVIENHILTQHVKYEHLRCDSCSELFSTERQLAQHSRAHKKGESLQVTSVDPQPNQREREDGATSENKRQKGIPPLFSFSLFN